MNGVATLQPAFWQQGFFDSCMSDRSHQTPLPYTQNRNKKKKRARKRPLCSLRPYLALDCAHHIRPSRILLATLALLHNKRQTTHEKYVFFFFSPWLRQAFFDNLAVMMSSGRILPAHLMNGCSLPACHPLVRPLSIPLPQGGFCHSASQPYRFIAWYRVKASTPDPEWSYILCTATALCGLLLEADC